MRSVPTVDEESDGKRVDRSTRRFAANHLDIVFPTGARAKDADNLLYQDNMSSILLEKNVRWSSTKRTRHIDMRYFFVKDRVKSGEAHIEHLSDIGHVGRRLYKATTRYIVLQTTGPYHEH